MISLRWWWESSGRGRGQIADSDGRERRHREVYGRRRSVVLMGRRRSGRRVRREHRRNDRRHRCKGTRDYSFTSSKFIDRRGKDCQDQHKVQNQEPTIVWRCRWLIVRRGRGVRSRGRGIGRRHRSRILRHRRSGIGGGRILSRRRVGGSLLLAVAGHGRREAERKRRDTDTDEQMIPLLQI